MKNKNIRNVPTLRFPGFEGEWERCKVGDIATTTIGEFVIKTKQNDSYPYPVYNGGRTNTGFYDKYNNEGNKILVSARGNAGFVNIIKTRYWAGNSCYSIDIIDKNKNNVDFTYYEMKLKENVFIKNQQSATIPSVSKSAVENFELLTPIIQEQTKIGSFLATIDALISETEKELEAYREQKHGMLQKMFPKKGADVPEIRFPGFTDALEQRKLFELAEKTYGGGTPATSNEAFWNGNIPWIQSSDILDGKLFGVEPRKHITQEGLNNSATQLVPENSIAIITRVGVGKLAFMPFSYTTSQDFLSLSKLNTEPFFTVYACYKKLQSELNAVQGTSIKGITKDELLAKIIMVPKYAEQQKIGVFFKQLDNLITLHQRELDKLIELKKGFMQKMFC